MMVTEVLGEILLPKFMSMIINHGVAQKDGGYILKMGLVMAITSFLMAAGGILGAYFAAKASISFTSDLRRDLFARVQQFSFKNIDTFSTGSLVTRLTNDIQQVQNLIMMGLRMMLRAPGMFLGALVMAFWMNAELAAVILVVIPLLTAAIVWILRTAYPRFTAMQKALDTLNSGIQEVLTNVRVVKSFVREDYEEKRFADTNRELKEAGLRALKIVIATMPVMMFAMNVTTLAVVWFGGNLIIGGRMAVGDLTAFTTYIVQILMSLMMLSMVFLQSSRAMASIRRIDEVLDEPIDLSDENASQKDRKVEKGRVEFKDVSFSYREGGEPVLSHISLTAEPGETIGILGATGSGKTSLVQLIPRLYDVTEGSVRVDGIDVREYSLKNLRDGVGMVLQKNVLFSGTIEENLRWGDETATEEEVRRAAVYAQADSFVNSFAEGYKTEMGQGGVNVSGGQKQRLCIARALLKKPKILILDDSTSAVDTATEAAIRTAFREDLKDTTKFIIAQRLSSLEYADRILVLEDGRIIGEGTQEKLLASCEAYREIYETQYGKRADGEGMA
ncbi:MULTISPECIES: ABC transporter ATP-binding protein [Clostridium]|jgi:ATP-binding cassette subfamily B multidrug efflux pump|uniref:ABC transporter n=2 Tax=Clostridium TaxID=1485 RepID=A0A2T3FVK8_9CLOT|nr:ABC transporter ATP-binding protein [Clostridium segne]MCC2170988.1 ABC transporter ATP-binding protein/permease [Clostridium fessum]RHO12695.1 ABC transporter ATP-binding protein [Clostridium sp. AM18-55]RHP40823.1 ABC transporter ATP-binding protein [Clostridium sp. AF32-7AC]RHP58154.1 ABC transporter ATP-binding protein [Clostridium sp. AF29-8BH]RHQ70348.1 ABC transporter ATP-binding protein [Clostridium sp. AF24-2LB]RHR03251.1 ABC transporter ATP-binding protein [Clostridium sp. AF20-7